MGMNSYLNKDINEYIVYYKWFPRQDSIDLTLKWLRLHKTAFNCIASIISNQGFNYKFIFTEILQNRYSTDDLPEMLGKLSKLIFDSSYYLFNNKIIRSIVSKYIMHDAAVFDYCVCCNNFIISQTRTIKKYRFTMKREQE
jgi:hypothetical protein